MGVRQHLAELENKGFVTQTREEKQTRGRPVHLWRLTQTGHQRFPDGYPQLTLELLDVIRSDLGEDSMNQLIDSRNEPKTNSTIYRNCRLPGKTSKAVLRG
ncbi:MAG: hypothetical protein Ct9H300mP22_4550 [Gammaproteobacteria bacterium]|nr:MAG: hypothetical protein Ct9H300mP22_4550 [Gammaproteobacteria bacterium]